MTDAKTPLTDDRATQSPRDGMAPPVVPPNQAALFAAHDRMLHDAVDWLDSTRAPLRTIGDRILLLLAARILQLGAALQRLCETGHAGEAAPIARSMVSACVILAYIAEDRDGHAAAFMETQQAERKKRITDIKREHATATAAGERPIVSQEELDEIDRTDVELTRREAAKFAALADQGIVPTRLGRRRDTFTGFNTERELFEAMKARYWYLSYYKFFSDEVHVSANALATELAEQLGGQSLVGPKFEDPRYVLTASRDVIRNALDQIDKGFGLQQGAERTAVDAPMTAALAAFAAQTTPAAAPASPPTVA